MSEKSEDSNPSLGELKTRHLNGLKSSAGRVIVWIDNKAPAIFLGAEVSVLLEHALVVCGPSLLQKFLESHINHLKRQSGFCPECSSDEPNRLPLGADRCDACQASVDATARELGLDKIPPLV